MSNSAKLNLIGGSAYSSTGGIQAMNRLLVRELEASNLLRKAHFLWDDTNTVSEEGRLAQDRGSVQFYSLGRFAFARNLALQTLKFPRDLWLCTHLNYTALGLMVNRWRSRRVGVMLHAAELDEDLTPLKRFALRQAGFVVAVSEFTKRKAMAHGVRASRIHVVPNGVDDPCPHWREAEAKDEEAPRIYFVGRMDERYKGQMELLDAVKLLQTRWPGLRMIFVGGGATLDEWKAEAARRGLDDLVVFSGRVSDEELRKSYADATVFAMPSENEGFGLVYAEAMAFGVPCIGSDRDAAREVISHEQTGYCVPSGNSTAVADAIHSLLKSPQRRAAMAVASRRRFLECFSADQYRLRLAATLDRWLVSCS